MEPRLMNLWTNAIDEMASTITSVSALCDEVDDDSAERSAGTPTQENEQEEEEEQEEDNMIPCADCGVLFSPDDSSGEVNTDGDPVCDSCGADYGHCDRCGEVTSLTDLIPISDRRGNVTEHVCGDCLSGSQYFTCDDCGRSYPTRWLALSDDDQAICDQCADDWDECAECGELCHHDDMGYSDCHNAWYCDYCYERLEPEYDEDDSDGNSIHDYGYKPWPVFHGESNSFPALYMGVELEIDDGDSRRDCADEICGIMDASDHLYIKTDGSLHSDGLEIVTHPCTLKYHLETFPWREITKVARSNGYKSHNTSTCGLHVHVSRDALGDSTTMQEATIAKIILMVDRFWDRLSTFSRRNLDHSRWAAKPNVEIGKDDTIASAIQKVKSSSVSRYRAVNLQNRATIEFRIFKGTLKVNTIKATLEFVDNMCRFAKEHTLERCLEAAWEDVVLFKEYPELLVYLRERRLVPPSQAVEEAASLASGDTYYDTEAGGDLTDALFVGLSAAVFIEDPLGAAC